MAANIPATPAPLDNRKVRSEATRGALMRAAEKLIATRGIGNISIRDILQEADQKNTSALQYHFKNLDGLIEAIHVARSEEIQHKRAQLIAVQLIETPEPDLRTVCLLMTAPVMELARTDVGFRRYVQAFGHELALSHASAASTVQSRGAGGSSGEQLERLLRAALPHLKGEAFARRMELAVRQCSASMFHQSRHPSAFRGDQAELFVNSLTDALVGLLSAPESKQTKAAAKRLRASK